MGNQYLLSEEELRVTPEVQRAYDAIVRPNAILPVPRYYLEQWLPLLGTSRAWVVLAFRQVAFVSRSSHDEVPVCTTLRKLGRWCGLTHVRIHQVLKDPGYLTWFVRNPHGDLADRQSPRSQPTDFMVRADIPLTPQDQARLSLWFEKRSPTDDGDWLHTIEEAIEAKKLELPRNCPLPEISLTIQQLVYAQRGEDIPLPPSLDQACTELHARWIQPDRVTLATHYFLLRWLPDLSPGLGWLVLLLRSRVYQENDAPIGQVWISGGLTSLATELGLSRKSLSRWVESDHARAFFHQRSDVQDPNNRRNLLLVVRLSEPIHPNDQAKYHQMLQGQDLTTPISIDRQNLTNLPSSIGQALTTCGEPSTDISENLTSLGQGLPAVSHSLTSERTNLNKDGTKFNALKTFKIKNKITIKDDPNQHEQVVQLIPKIPLPFINQWQIEEILSRAGVGKKVRQSISQASQEELLFFIGWLLFALSLPKIQYPVFFAYKRHQETAPPQSFLQLAKIPTAQCYHWLTGRLEGIPPDLIKTVSELRKQDAHLKLMEIGAIPFTFLSMLTDLQSEGNENRVTMGDVDKHSISTLAEGVEKMPLALEHAWKVVRGRLQAEVDRATFDTWVRDVEAMGVQGETMLLGVANDYARQWLEERLKETIEQTMFDTLGEIVKVRFVVLDEINR